MAGSGRRVFQPGEVLTASNTMNYLMDQSVMVFAGTAARGSAIGTAVAEGMVSYLKDVNQTQFYDGASWITLADSSGLPVLNGGTGGTSISTAQANLRVGVSNIIPASVSVVAGSATVGATGVVTATNVRYLSFNNIFTSEFTRYDIHYNLTYSSAALALGCRFRVDSTDDAGSSDYRSSYASYLNGPLDSTGVGLSDNIRFGRVGNNHSSGIITILYPTNASSYTTGFGRSYDGDGYSEFSAGIRNTTKAHNGFTFNVNATITVSGTFKIYGFKD